MIIRDVKGIIPDRIFYPHPHFLLQPTQKGDGKATPFTTLVTSASFFVLHSTIL